MAIQFHRAVGALPEETERSRKTARRSIIEEIPLFAFLYFPGYPVTSLCSFIGCILEGKKKKKKKKKRERDRERERERENAATQYESGPARKGTKRGQP